MMSFFRNLTIRARLTLLTLLLCSFTAVAAWVGYTRIVASGEDLDTMYGSGVLPVLWTTSAGLLPP